MPSEVDPFVLARKSVESLQDAPCGLMTDVQMPFKDIRRGRSTDRWMIQGHLELGSPLLDKQRCNLKVRMQCLVLYRIIPMLSPGQYLSIEGLDSLQIYCFRSSNRDDVVVEFGEKR